MWDYKKKRETRSVNEEKERKPLKKIVILQVSFICSQLRLYIPYESNGYSSSCDNLVNHSKSSLTVQMCHGSNIRSTGYYLQCVQHAFLYKWFIPCLLLHCRQMMMHTVVDDDIKLCTDNDGCDIRESAISLCRNSTLYHHRIVRHSLVRATQWIHSPPNNSQNNPYLIKRDVSLLRSALYHDSKYTSWSTDISQ